MSTNHDAQWDAAEEGAELIREGSLDSAVIELSRVIEVDPTNMYAHHHLGTAYYELHDYPKAMKHQLRAVELSPNYLGALVGLGHALRMLNRHTEAIKVAHHALAQQPNDGDVLYLLGLLHMARNEAAVAQDYFQQFLRTRPKLDAAYEVQEILESLEQDLISEEKPAGELN